MYCHTCVTGLLQKKIKASNVEASYVHKFLSLIIIQHRNTYIFMSTVLNRLLTHSTFELSLAVATYIAM